MSQQLDIQRPRPGSGIGCLGFKPYSAGSLRGFYDFYVVGWHFRIFGATAHAANGKRWIGLPGKPLVDAAGQPQRDDAGKVRYTPFCAFDDKDLLHRFSDAACAALDAYHPGWDT